MFRKNSLSMGFLIFFVAVTGIITLAGVLSTNYMITFRNQAATSVIEDDNFAEGTLRISEDKYFLDTGVEMLEIFNPSEEILESPDGSTVRIGGYKKGKIFILEQDKFELVSSP